MEDQKSPADLLYSYVYELFKSGANVITLRVEEASKILNLDAFDLAVAIDELRGRGLYIPYDLNKGYVFNLDDNVDLFKEALSGICDLIILDEVDTTMEVAWDLIKRGSPSWTVVLALKQRRGRGRWGREWISPPGGLWFSVILRQRGLLRNLCFLSLACSLAVADSIKFLTKLDAWVKWPNDVMIEKEKVAGILVEGELIKDAINVVIGCGINVNNEPPHVDKPATSIIRYLGRPISRAQLLRMVLLRLRGILSVIEALGAEHFLNYYKSYTRLIGSKVKVIDKEGAYIGRIVDISEDCSLVLNEESLGRMKFYDAELILLE